MQGGRGQDLDRNQEVDRVQPLVQEVQDQEVGVRQVNQAEGADRVGLEVRAALARIKKGIMLQISTRCISVHFGIIKRIRRIIQRKRNIVIIYIHN